MKSVTCTTVQRFGLTSLFPVVFLKVIQFNLSLHFEMKHRTAFKAHSTFTAAENRS